MNEIENILTYLENSIRNRLSDFFFQKTIERPVYQVRQDGALSNFIRDHGLGLDELILLASALVPHVKPGFFDQIILEYLPQGGDFPEFGGIKGEHHRGMLATGETVLFILAGNDLEKRIACFSLFEKEQKLFKTGVLSLEPVKTGEPKLSGKILLEPEYVEQFTTGKISLPELSINFPAEHLHTEMLWEDLVLPEAVWSQIKDLEIWLSHRETLEQHWDIGRKIKPGYRALFHGPPGTGKTLTATLLGKYTGKEVFRIDLSMIVSKFIGETEKNLSKLFDKADNKDWILFFDEADAIFGKRTGVRDAHDRYANQEVSYLLQRIENYSGLVILATNFKSNVDQAFVRRFNAMVYFPPPNPKERLRLWKKSLPNQISLSKELDLKEIADKHELTGAHILNIVQYLSLSALESRDFVLTSDKLMQGIKRELEKEGK